MASDIRVPQGQMSINAFADLAEEGGKSIGAQLLEDGSLVLSSSDKTDLPSKGVNAQAQQMIAKQALFDAIETTYGSKVATEIFSDENLGGAIFGDSPLMSEDVAKLTDAAEELVTKLDTADQKSGPSPTAQLINQKADDDLFNEVFNDKAGLDDDEIFNEMVADNEITPAGDEDDGSKPIGNLKVYLNELQDPDNDMLDNLVSDAIDDDEFGNDPGDAADFMDRNMAHFREGLESHFKNLEALHGEDFLESQTQDQLDTIVKERAQRFLQTAMDQDQIDQDMAASSAKNETDQKSATVKTYLAELRDPNREMLDNLISDAIDEDVLTTDPGEAADFLDRNIDHVREAIDDWLKFHSELKDLDSLTRGELDEIVKTGIARFLNQAPDFEAQNGVVE